jgi:cell division septation protein DedD
MMRIGLGVILSMGIVFVSGYVVGFQKAEKTLRAQTPSTVPGIEVAIALPLPEPMMSDPRKMKPNTPLFTDPGETVDVDNPDEEQLAKHEEKQSADLPTIRENKLEARSEARSEARQLDKLAGLEKVKVPSKLVGKLEGQLVVMSENTQNAAHTSIPKTSAPILMGRAIEEAIGGPAESDPAMIMNGDKASQVAIYDNATEETASYSIQVGMFGLLENAERKVEELITVDLSAYLVEYMNKQSKLRYKVCFGYFADRKSAINALVIYKKELAGSGYVIPLKSSKDSISKTSV